MAKKVIFLDRDGTLNVDQGYVHRQDDWQFTERAPEAVRMLKEAGFHLAVVSNQSGIGRGFFTMEDVTALHEYVQEQLATYETCLDVITICPHAPTEACSCRKPRTGMAHVVEQHLREAIDYHGSWTVGDKPSDVAFGHTLGTKTVLIRSKYWNLDSQILRPDLVADSLYEAASMIISREQL